MARREYGSGSLRERSPGVWLLRVYAGKDPLTGKPRQIARTVHTKKKQEARAALKALLAEVGQGRHEGTSGTFGSLLDKWLAHKESNGKLAPTSLETYRQHVDKRIAPALGDVKLSDLSPYHLDRFYASLREDGLSGRTVRLIHWIISGALTQGVKWRWLSRNAAQGAEPGEIKREELVLPSPAQLQQLVAKAQAEGDDDLAFLIAIAALTGLRRGEVCGLQWRDVDWAQGVLTVERSIKVVGSGQEEGPPKNKKKRLVVLSQAALAVLKSYWALQQSRLSFFGREQLEEDGWVFSHNCGQDELKLKRVSEAVAALGRRLEPPVDVHLHLMRHFAATQLAGKADSKTVADQLGHDPGVLLDVYSHAVPERAREAAAHLADVAALPIAEAASSWPSRDAP